MAATRVAEPTAEVAPVEVQNIEVPEEQVPVAIPHNPVTVAPTTKSARVKGTWTQYYGRMRFDFVDKQRYDLPLEVYNYLKEHDCIYDTI